MRRRSTKRELALLTIVSWGEVHPRALAQALGVDPARLKQIMFGDGVAYSFELSPVMLGLVVLEESPQGRVWRPTARGRRKARQLSARRVRAQVARRAGREWARGPTHVHPHLRNALATADPTPAVGPSFAWSVDA